MTLLRPFFALLRLGVFIALCWGVFPLSALNAMETTMDGIKTIRLRPTGDAAGPKPLDILIIETGE